MWEISWNILGDFLHFLGNRQKGNRLFVDSRLNAIKVSRHRCGKEPLVAAER